MKKINIIENTKESVRSLRDISVDPRLLRKASQNTLSEQDLKLVLEIEPKLKMTIKSNTH